MALRRVLFSGNRIKIPVLIQKTNFSTQLTREVEEITIPVPWGHVSGKWYGPKDIRPIVGLHGWQDNAGTFDTLAPLLPQHVGFLAIDLPGHGLSSKIPNGMTYHSIDYVTFCLTLMKFYNWEKISVIAHSMSAVNTYIFTALFPEKIDMFVGLDILKPLMMNPTKLVTALSERLHGVMLENERNQSNKEPPSYSFDECVERLYKGTNKSVEKEFCKHLLERNLAKSEKDPEKFYFRRDARLKASMFYMFPHESILEMGKRITAPHLFIKARQAPFYENRKYYDDVLSYLKANKSLFEHYDVDGTHHVHLNEAEKISKIVNPFIMKYRPKYSE
ncbi:hypothetical protein ACFFRR_011788 [Megaselia abdita]